MGEDREVLARHSATRYSISDRPEHSAQRCRGWAQYEFEEEVRDGLLIRRSPQYTYYNKVDRLQNWQGNLLGGHKAPPSELVKTSAGNGGA